MKIVRFVVVPVIVELAVSEIEPVTAGAVAGTVAGLGATGSNEVE